MKRISILLSLLGLYYLSIAQSPEAINYQAVLRDDNGEIISNQSIIIQFEIHDINNIVAYKEKHSLQTNQFGLITAKIGEGTIITGLLDAVNWGGGIYYLKVSLDLNDGNGFVELGDNHLVSVPYALHAKTVENANDADADPLNEIQQLTLIDDTLFLSSGGYIILPTGFSGDYTDLTNAPTNLSDFSNNLGFVTSANDADSDSTNELQLLSISNDTVFLTDGGFVMLPTAIDTDDQTLSISNDSLIIQDGNRVDLSPYLDNTDAQVLSLNGDTVFLSNGGYVVLPSGTIDTDDQTLSISGDTITIADGNFIVLSGWDTDTTDDFSGDWSDLANIPSDIVDGDNVNDADADSTNELQLLSLSGDTIYLTGGGFVVLPSGTVDTDDQTLSISNDSLIIQDGNRVDLSPYLDNTDAQVLSLNGDTVFLSNGGYVVLPSGTIDTDDQTLSISGDTITIADGNFIVLSGWDTDTTDDFSGDYTDLTNAPTNLSDFSNDLGFVSTTDDADADSTNELQLLSLSGDTIYLTGGGFVVLPSGTVDTDDQTLSISNDSLVIQDGNRVDLSPYLDNTDAQVLSLNGDTVFLSNGGFVVLPSGTIDTDDQTLSISGDTISIADGNFIVLSGWDTDTTDDFSGDYTDLANAPTNLSDFSNDLGFVSTTDDADADSTNELQLLSLSGDTIYLTDGGFVVLPSGTVDTDDQTLSISNDSLVIQDGNRVDLSPYLDNTDAQVLSLNGDTVFLSNGGYVILPSGTIDTDDQTLSISGDTITIADGNFIVLSGWDTDTMDDFSGDWLDLANIPSDILDGDSVGITTETDPIFAASPASGISNGDITNWNNDLVNDADADSTNELQVLSLSNDTIYLTDGGFVVLPSGTVDTDDQTLSISNDSLIIQDGNRVDLSPYLDNTDAQVLSLNGDTVFLSNGGYVVLPSGTIDTDDQTLSISGDTISIADGNFIVLSGWDTDTTDDFSGDWSDLANIPSDILDGDSVGITTEIDPVFTASPASGISNGDITNWNNDLVNDADADSTNELQILSLSNDTIYLTDGGFVVLPAGTIDTDDQTLTLTGEDLEIADGNTVSFTGWDTDTTDDFSGDYTDLTNAPTNLSDFSNDLGFVTTSNDADADSTNELQLLSLSGDTVYLTDGGFVVLPAGTVDTDDQTLTLTGEDLEIVDGNTVSFTGWDTDTTDDFSGDYTDLINVPSNLSDFSNDIGFVTTSDDADADSTNELQLLSISNDTVYLTDGGFVVLPSGSGEFTSSGGVVYNTTDQVNDDFVFGSDQLGNKTGTDDDNRFFFDKSKAAFRAGSNNNLAYWDEDSLGSYSTAFGQGTRAISDGSFASGLLTEARGSHSFAAGNNSLATGTSSFTMGYYTVASGSNSIALGYGTEATGQSSTALGHITNATGDYSTSMGEVTVASARSSTAMGSYSTASGSFSTAIGLNVEAPSYSEATFGCNPVLYSPSSSLSFNASDRIFSVGNGSGVGSRSNAMTILKSGYTGLGTINPTTTLHVDGGFRYVDGNQATNYILASDASGNATWIDPISVSSGGEFDTTGNVVHNTSDMANNDFVFGSDQINNQATAADDNLFFFDKSKAAFRAGSNNNLAYWDEDSLGTYSSAFGYRNRAKGMYSFAAGRNTQAIGAGATALGSNSIASGSYSLATGSNTEASGIYSFSGGFNTNATGSYSLAMGYFSDATGLGSIAFGNRNLASGNYASAFGNYTDATGSYSSSFGNYTLASGLSSAAFGYYTDATGPYSTAFGNTTVASASGATAFGYRTKAVGNYSLAMGYYADAYSFIETTIGMYPDTTNYTPYSTTSYSSGDRLFSVANGRGSTTRSNAITILKNGNVGIGTTTPARGLLEVSGYTYNTAVTPTQMTTSLGAYRYLSSSSSGNTIGSRPISIYASNDIAALQFDAFSDKRIKNIKGISDATTDLNTLSQIQITDYTLIDSIGKGDKEYKKVIAQQVKEVYPQAVSEISDYIPNIYTLSEIKDGWINLDTDLEIGDNVKLIFAHGDELLNVEEVSEQGFRVNFDKDEKVFVFGKLVDDFHTVDYESISMLNVSATQELLRMVAQLQQKNAALENTLNEQEASLQNQMQMNNQQQAQIDKIMEMLEMSSRRD